MIFSKALPQFFNTDHKKIMNSKFNKLKSYISNAACTKLKGDGKIFVSDVEAAIDICSGDIDTNAI